MRGDASGQRVRLHASWALQTVAPTVAVRNRQCEAVSKSRALGDQRSSRPLPITSDVAAASLPRGMAPRLSYGARPSLDPVTTRSPCSASSWLDINQRRFAQGARNPEDCRDPHDGAIAIDKGFLYGLPDPDLLRFYRPKLRTPPLDLFAHRRRQPQPIQPPLKAL